MKYCWKEKKRKMALRLVFLSLLSLLPSQNIDSASAAGTIVYSNIYNGCVIPYSNTSYIHVHRYLATSTTTISAINNVIGNQSKIGFSSANYYIMSDNAVANYPNLILATFTADTITGTGLFTTARFVGNYTVSAGTKFWIVPAQGSSTFPQCYNNQMSNSTYSHTTIDVDSTTSAATTYRAYTSTIPPTSGWVFAATDANVFQLSIEAGASIADTITVSIDAGGNSATYRAITRIRADVFSDGKVTFYEGKKIIPGCKSILSSSTRAYCDWRPSVHGGVTLSAIVNPTSASYLRGTSQGLPVGVTKRTNSR